MPKEAYIKCGDLMLERDCAGNISITRQSTAQRVTLSISELSWLVDAHNLMLTPVVPPVDPTVRTDPSAPLPELPSSG